MPCYPCTRCGGCDWGEVGKVDERVCPQCGHYNEYGLKRCEECGYLMPPVLVNIPKPGEGSKISVPVPTTS